MIIVGRKPVLEALASDVLRVEKVAIATTLRGDFVADVHRAADAAGVVVDVVAERRIDALAGDDRQHQGIVATVEVPEPVELGAFLAARQGRDWPTQLLLLDQIHNPANVGMILRTAAAAGIDGVIVPRRGTAAIGPLTVKAGAGVIFAVPILDVDSVDDAVQMLIDEGVALVGVDAGGATLWDIELPPRAAWVLGNESAGLSSVTAAALDATVAMPMARGVESLNVAAAAAVLSYELVRRRA